MLLVTGKLSALENVDSTTIAYFVLDEGMFGNEGIRISLFPEETGKLSASNLNKLTNIKGLCSGYNDTEIILEHGSIQ